MNSNECTIQDKQPPSTPSPIYRRFYFFTLIASLVGAAFQMILLLSQYDKTIGTYHHNSIPAVAFSVYTVAVVVMILCMPLICRKQKTEEITSLPRTELPIVFASTLCGFILLTLLYFSLIGGKLTSAGKMASVSDYCWLAILALLIPTAIYFFLPAFPRAMNKKTDAALAFFPILWCCAYLMSVFFDPSTPLHSPVRILIELAIIASMLFFLLELRVKVGKKNSPLLFVFVNVSIFFSTICAIPIISVAFIHRWELSTDILYCAVQLCFLTYFVARANSLMRSR